MNIVDMANIVNECVVEIGKEPVAIHVTPQDIQLSSGMNCDRIMEELDWLPQYSFQDTVKACVEYEISRK